MKKKIILITITVFTSISGLFMTHKKSLASPHVQEIMLEDLRSKKSEKKSFILMLERPSCRFCAIVFSAYIRLHSDFENISIPELYYLNLEQFYTTEQYDEIKNELNITYLPSIKYYHQGIEQYNLNNPLDEAYYDAQGNQRQQLYRNMQDRLIAFINGVTEDGPVIHEELIPLPLHATPIPVTEDNNVR